MNKLFINYSANENNPKWENMIKREKDVTEVKEVKAVKPKTTKAKTTRTRKPKVKAEEP